jgi:hypothetical protein
MGLSTFQYLLSALAQVFGALVFGVAVFLVLRYQQLRSAKEELRKRVTWALTRVHHPEGEIAGASLIVSDQLKFEALSDAELAGEVEKVGNSHVSAVHSLFEAKREELREVPRRAIPVMALPSAACWLFSIALLNADRLQRAGKTEAAAWVSAVVALLVLAFVVSWSVCMLREPASNASPAADSDG